MFEEIEELSSVNFVVEPRVKYYRIPEQTFAYTKPFLRKNKVWKIDVLSRDGILSETHQWSIKIFFPNPFGENGPLCMGLDGYPCRSVLYEKAFCVVRLLGKGSVPLVSYKKNVSGKLCSHLLIPNICDLSKLSDEVVITPQKITGITLLLTLGTVDDVSPIPAILSFKSMLDKNFLTDMVIKTKEENLKCHKLVLAANSEFFAAMFQTEMVEKETNIIDWTDVFEAEVVKALLHYMYTLTKPVDIQDHHFALLEAAQLCLLPGLKDMCISSLKANICSDNATHILRVSETFNLRELKTLSVAFIKKNWARVKVAQSYKNLNLETRAWLLDTFVTAVAEEK